MTFTLTSKRDDAAKAIEVLAKRAKAAGYGNLSTLERQVTPDGLYTFSITAS